MKYNSSNHLEGGKTLLCYILSNESFNVVNVNIQNLPH